LRRYYRHIAEHAELELIRYEVDLYLRAALQVEQGRLDAAARHAQIQNSPTKQQAPVGQENFGISFARIRWMPPLFAVLLSWESDCLRWIGHD
jgi:hypothetical protein